MHLPPVGSEAVFYLETTDADCSDNPSGPKCEAYARAAHANMLRHFGLQPYELPLLKLDPWNWDAPFQSMKPLIKPGKGRGG